MHVYGTTREQMSLVAATIRNNGSANPEAVYYQRGPFIPDDITASRRSPTRSTCSTAQPRQRAAARWWWPTWRSLTSHGRPVYVLGSGSDFFGPSYQHPPAWDLTGRAGTIRTVWSGRHAADMAFAHAGIGRDEVDVLELYDPFSFEIIRQLEAFRFCPDGEGGPFVDGRAYRHHGSHPVTTDGGTMSFSHAGTNPQMMQRAIRGGSADTG